MSIETLEELRERLAEAQASLDRAEEEAAKIERLHAGIPDDDEGPELVEPGIDDIKMDKHGGVWIGDERVGGADIIINEIDPITDSAFKNLKLSPRDLQLIGERSRDDAGRFTANPEPEEPFWRTPCGCCGEVIDMNKVNPLRPMWNQETGEGFVEHICRCGETLITQGDELPGEVQLKALENDAVMDIVIRDYMERPPKW
jgi:hypothetical protein